MDIFSEQIISKKWSIGDWLKLSGLILFCLILITVVFLATGNLEITTFLLFGGGAAVYYLYKHQDVEYEYSVTNGYVTVDKIHGKSRRKRLITFETREVKKFDMWEDSVRDKNFDTKIFACYTTNNPDSWYLELNHPAKARTLLVFDPNERILEAMKPYVSKRIDSPIWRSTK